MRQGGASHTNLMTRAALGGAYIPVTMQSPRDTYPGGGTGLQKPTLTYELELEEEEEGSFLSHQILVNSIALATVLCDATALMNMERWERKRSWEDLEATAVWFELRSDVN